MNHSTKTAMLLSIALLAACGGGGSDPTPPDNVNAFPNVSPSAGDWYVYTSTVTPTLPTGAAPSERTITRHYRVVNSDGSFTRTDIASTVNSLASRAYNTSGALVTYTSGTQLCTYAPAFRSGPPLTSVLADSFTATSTESCAIQPSGAPTLTTLSANGSNQSTESRSIPLGTFSTFKYSQTIVASSASGVTTTLETCWIDRNTGRAVECTSTYSTVPVGQLVATASGSRIFRLEGYSFRGQTPVGAAVRRFSGNWKVNFAGSSIGDCGNLLIDINGQISGSCRFLTSAGVYGPSFAVTGTVGANGAATVSATTGANMTGTFTSPESANGTWVNTGASGTWTAAHI